MLLKLIKSLNKKKAGTSNVIDLETARLKLIDTNVMGFGSVSHETYEDVIDCICDNCGNEWVEKTLDPIHLNTYRVYEKCSFCMQFKTDH